MTCDADTTSAPLPCELYPHCAIIECFWPACVDEDQLTIGNTFQPEMHPCPNQNVCIRPPIHRGSCRTRRP